MVGNLIDIKIQAVNKCKYSLLIIKKYITTHA